MSTQDPDYLDGRSQGQHDSAHARYKPQDNPNLESTPEPTSGLLTEERMAKLRSGFVSRDYTDRWFQPARETDWWHVDDKDQTP